MMDSVRTAYEGLRVRSTGMRIAFELGAEAVELDVDEARELCATIAQKIKRAEYAAGQVATIKGWIGAPR